MSDVIVPPANPGVAIEEVKIDPRSKGYEEKKWAGKDIFVCKGCGADSFNETLVKQHVASVHR
jgi:hypothetical protein